MQSIKAKVSAKLFYIGRRYNPQLSKPYFRAYGQLSKKMVSEKENCAYGSMSLEGFETESAYIARIEELKAQGYRVNL